METRGIDFESLIDVDGKVLVWHIAEAKYKRLAPIDAREQLNRGIVSLTAPAEVAEQPPEPVKPESFNVDKAHVGELRGHAESLNIIGAASMTKEELKVAIREAQQTGGSDATV